MQIRCSSCGRSVTVAATGVLPERCPHCQGAPVPDQLGRWRIERLLAAGGMGEVYLARHRELGSKVAIKLLPALPGSDAEALRQRFLREAVLTAAIEHPGVVRVLDFEADGARTFLVLEYLDGRTLRSRLREGLLPVAHAVGLARQVAEVLAAAHAHGVVHRDLKPENVLVTADGQVRVLDFGIARALQDQEPITRTGEILGTPEYMAPEQLLEAPEAIDARTDVHALAVLLYELLTGRSPFHGPNLFAVLKLVESLVPQPPSTLRAAVPPALDAVVMRGLAKETAERFADAAAFAAALAEAWPAQEDEAAPAPPSARHWLWPCAVALAFALGLWIGPRSRGPSLPSTPVAPDPAGGLARLLTQPFVDEADLARAVTALGEVDAPALLLLRGRARLRIGACTTALQDLDTALQGGLAEAAEPAAVAWLLANTLLPTALGAPEWLLAVDRQRRDRLFGLGTDDARTLPDTPLAKAMSLLARGEAGAAFAALRPPPGEHLKEPAATVALLAACRACADRMMLQTLAVELQPEHPDPAFVLLRASLGEPEALAAALRARAGTLHGTAPDRWLLELGAAFVDCARREERGNRMRGLAELAWLTGAGELAPLWYIGLRLQLAAWAQPALTAEEAQRLLPLLEAGDARNQPAVAAARALLHVASGESEVLAKDLDELAAAADPLLAPFRHWREATANQSPEPGGLWHSFARLLVGNRRDAFAGLARLDRGPSRATAELLRAVFAGEGDWALALGGDFAPLELLRPLPGRPLRLPLREHISTAVQKGLAPDQLLPALRLYGRLGNDPAPLLELPALQPLRQHPLWTSYQREVQGGIERR